jgi:glycosyltransferase involved in cell wall biosynthesis
MARAVHSILFISHSASLNGASMLLLHLLRWLRANTPHRLEVLCLGGGPLVEPFREVATTHVWRSPFSLLRDRATLGSLRAGAERLGLRALLRYRRHALVYANTAAVWPQVAALGAAAGPVLWHVHELPYALRLSLNDPARAQLAKAEGVIAVSQAVAEALTSEFSVARNVVDVVHGFVPTVTVADDAGRQARARIRAEFGWPSDAFVIGACGGPGWRKGSDLFLQIAKRLVRSAADDKLRFLWVGGGAASEAESLQFAHDMQALGLQGRCRRVPATSNVDDHYAAMDLFALTSREDPFPLVMLEAGLHRLPTLCFAGAGGGAEFVGQDAGIAVPYLDLEAFAQAAEHLRAHAAQRQAMGAAAERKVRAHHGVEAQSLKVLRCIERCIARTHVAHDGAVHAVPRASQGD